MIRWEWVKHLSNYEWEQNHWYFVIVKKLHIHYISILRIYIKSILNYETFRKETFFMFHYWLCGVKIYWDKRITNNIQIFPLAYFSKDLSTI